MCCSGAQVVGQMPVDVKDLYYFDFDIDYLRSELQSHSHLRMMIADDLINLKKRILHRYESTMSYQKDGKIIQAIFAMVPAD